MTDLCECGHSSLDHDFTLKLCARNGKSWGKDAYTGVVPCEKRCRVYAPMQLTTKDET